MDLSKYEVQGTVFDICPECLKAIKEYLEFRPLPKRGHEEYLFLSNNGRQLTSNFIWEMVKGYGVRARITKRIYPHLFRASALTHLDESGMSTYQIQMQSGHKSPESLKTYIRPDSRMVKAKVREALSLDKSSKSVPRPPKPPIQDDKTEPITKKKETPKDDVAYNKPIASKKEELYQLLKDEVITPSQYRELINDKTDSMYQ